MGTRLARTFGHLIAWQKAHELILAIRGFVLTARLRRAPASIAGEFKQSGRTGKAQFFSMSRGSIEECRYYLILARDLQYGEKSELNSLLEEVSKLLVSCRSVVLNSNF